MKTVDTTAALVEDALENGQDSDQSSGFSFLCNGSQAGQPGMYSGFSLGNERKGRDRKKDDHSRGYCNSQSEVGMGALEKPRGSRDQGECGSHPPELDPCLPLPFSR